MTHIVEMRGSFTMVADPVAAPRRDWLATAHLVLFIGFLLFTFVGTHPFAEASLAGRSDGNVLDRFAVIGLFLGALGVLWARRGIALAVFARNLPMFAVVGISLLSLLWSDYPDLTLRRAMLLFFLTVIAMACAVGTDDLRRLHTVAFITLTIVILINIGGVIVVPSIAISDIGVRGMYSQKNVAGIVALITMILGATWILGANQRSHKVYALLAMIPTAGFLVATISKTSINLTAIGLMMIMFFGLCERYGRFFILFAGAFGLILMSALVIWLSTLDFDLQLAMTMVIGDTSFSGRDELWAFTRRAAEKRSLLGHGYGAFWDVGKLNDPLVKAEPGSWLASVEIGIINQAHHGYLELWLHIGWPATVLATLVVIHGAVLGAWQALLGHGSRPIRAAFGAFTVLLILYLFHNFTEATLFMRGATFANMATLGLFVLSRARSFVAMDPEEP